MLGGLTMPVAAILFFVTFGLLLALPRRRAYISVISAGMFVALGILPPMAAFYTINWNVLLMLAGIMGVVSLFIQSGMPALLGDMVCARAPNVKWTIISLSLFGGLISAFADNVATVLILAPVTLDICKKLDISPIKAIIAISISVNLQGAATMVGDTAAILLSGQAGLNFLDFFFFMGRPGLFWVVQISAITSTGVLVYFFRSHTQPTLKVEHTSKVDDYFPSYLLVGIILLLVAASLIPPEFNHPLMAGFICLGMFGVGMLRESLSGRGGRRIKTALQELDLETLLLLGGLFVVVGGLTYTGAVELASTFFVGVGGDNIFIIFTMIVWISVLFSAIVDNVPYVAAMLPVIAGIADILGIPPYLLYFGLLSGATLGGNITPIGASSNLTAMGILRREGYTVNSLTFMKISVPFTLTAVTTGYILIWLLWG